MSELTMIEKLDALHPDLLAQFMRTGHCDGIPADVRMFLKQLQWAAEVYEFEKNVSRAAKTLQARIAGEQQIMLDIRTCKARIYSAINYFAVDDNVSSKIWEANYADRFEDLAKVCLSARDYKTAYKSFDKARECRQRATAIAEADRNMGIVFLMDPKIQPEDLGYEKKSIKEIAAKHNEGFYIKLINELPVEKSDKKRLLRDADIQEVEFLETNED